jgi:hypothetical protein
MDSPLNYVDPDGEAATAVVAVGGGIIIVSAAVLYHINQMNTNSEYRQAMTELWAIGTNILMGKASGNLGDSGLEHLTDEELQKLYESATGRIRSDTCAS